MDARRDLLELQYPVAMARLVMHISRITKVYGAWSPSRNKLVLLIEPVSGDALSLIINYLRRRGVKAAIAFRGRFLGEVLRNALVPVRPVVALVNGTDVTDALGKDLFAILKHPLLVKEISPMDTVELVLPRETKRHRLYLAKLHHVLNYYGIRYKVDFE